MKYIFVIFLCSCPFFIQAQAIHDFGQEIGVNLTYNPIDGMATTVRYRKDFTKGGVLKLELNSNFQNAFVGRIGYEFLQFRLGRFELGTGLDLMYATRNYSQIEGVRSKELHLELPIELRYKLTDNISAYSGMSLGTRLISKNLNVRYQDTVSEIRFGLGYRF